MKALLIKEALILVLLAASSGIGCGTGGMAAGDEQAAAAQEEFVFGGVGEEASPAAPDSGDDSGGDGGARPAPVSKQRPAGRVGEEETSSDTLTMRCRGGRDCIKTGTVGETLRWEFKVRDAASPAWSIEEAQTISGLRFGSAGDKAWIEGTPETSGIGHYTVRVCDGSDGACVEREAEIKIADDFRVELATVPGEDSGGAAGRGEAVDTTAFDPSHPLEIGFREVLLIEVQGFAPRYDIELLTGGESLKLVAATATRALLTVKDSDGRGAVVEASVRIRSHDYRRTEQVIELPPLTFQQNPCLVGFRIQSGVGPINSAQDWRNREMEFRAAGNVGPVTWELADDYVAVGESRFDGFRSCGKGETSDATLNVTCSFGYGNAPLPPTITDKAQEVREVLVIRAQDAACPGSAPVEGIFQFKLFPDLRRVRVRDLSVWLSLSGNDNSGSGSKRAGATMDVILKGRGGASAEVQFRLQDYGNDARWFDYKNFGDDDDELSLADIKEVSLRIQQYRSGEDEADLNLDVNYLIIFGDHYFALFDDGDVDPSTILDDNVCRGEVFRDGNIFDPDEPEAARYDITSKGQEGLIVMDITPFFAGFDVSEQDGTPPAEVNCMQGDHPRSIWQRNPMPYFDSGDTFIYHIIMSYPSYITRPED